MLKAPSSEIVVNDVEQGKKYEASVCVCTHSVEKLEEKDPPMASRHWKRASEASS